MPFRHPRITKFEESLAAFVKSLEADDAKLAAVLAQKLPELLKGNIEPSDIWDALEVASAGADVMTGWLLQSIEIEGLRGINNEGAPLTLRLKPDCVIQFPLRIASARARSSMRCPFRYSWRHS